MKILIYLIIIFTINLSSLAQFQDFGKNMEQWAEAFEKTVEEYSEAYSEALEEYSEAYSESMDSYSDAYNESMDSYSDAYNESMDSWEDSFKPVIPYKLNREMKPFGISYDDSFNKLTSIGKIDNIKNDFFNIEGWDEDLNGEDTFNGASGEIYYIYGDLLPIMPNPFFDWYTLSASIKSKQIFEIVAGRSAYISTDTGAQKKNITINDIKKIFKILENQYGEPIRIEYGSEYLNDSKTLIRKLNECDDFYYEIFNACWFVKDRKKNYFDIWLSCMDGELGIYYTRVKESHFNTDDPDKHFMDALTNESKEYETDQLFEGQSIDEISIGL